MVKKYPVRIDDIGKEKELASGTKLVDLKITRLDTQDEIKIACFLGKDGAFDVKEGEEFLIPIEEKEYKGKPQYSTTGWNWEALTEKDKPSKEVQEQAKEDKTLDILMMFDKKQDMSKNLLTMFNEVCPEWYKQSGPASATFLEIAKILLSKREN